MLILPCPWCGERPEGEFMNLGEAIRPRPGNPAALSDAEWTDYLSMRENRRGRHRERWWHMRGCGSIIAVERDTVSHEVFVASAGSSS
ncbi:SoxD Sarcosine oxidase delta subunit [Rhabdaerophilaceae bacterium]